MQNDLTQLGPYTLESRIGAGGMGEVWKAEDTRLRRTVAIKILPAAISHDVEAKGRLVREARTAAQLYHPNIATIHSIEQDGDRSFIVMEFVDGEPLSKLIAERRVSEADVIRIARAVAEALNEAHLRGIVHRDIKPDNIIVSGDRVKVLDFGIAKQVGYSAAVSSNDPTGVVTEVGVILGTIHYMSPEQALGKPLDGRSDIFSLGVVMYEALAGQVPFRGETVTETLTQIIRDDPADISKAAPSISPDLAEIVRRCLRKNRDERYATGRELSLALDGVYRDARTARTVASPPRAVSAAPTQITQSAAPPPRRRSSSWLWVLVPLALIAGIGLATLLRRVGSAPEQLAPVVPRTESAVPATTQMDVTTSVPPKETAAPTETATPQIIENTSTSSATVATSTVASVDQTKPSSAPNADELFRRGEEMRSQGNLTGAFSSYEAALLQDPNHAPSRLRLGEGALFGNDRATAESQFEQALKNAEKLSSHDQLVAKVGLAIAQEQDGVARTYLRVLEAAYPGDPESRRLRAELQRAEGRPRLPHRRRF